MSLLERISRSLEAFRIVVLPGSEAIRILLTTPTGEANTRRAQVVTFFPNDMRLRYVAFSTGSYGDKYISNRGAGGISRFKAWSEHLEFEKAGMICIRKVKRVPKPARREFLSHDFPILVSIAVLPITLAVVQAPK